ncbi:MAG: S4 domain-containing protein, partial [Atribacterota bacterium]|nr:S4 domain-containing protein [Atribacterota bacterium]
MELQSKTREIIYTNEENIRIDIYLAKGQYCSFSRNRIKELITQGNILVNDKKIKASYILKNGDRISINIPEQKELNLQPENIPLDIY